MRKKIPEFQYFDVNAFVNHLSNNTRDGVSIVSGDVRIDALKIGPFQRKINDLFIAGLRTQTVIDILRPHKHPWMAHFDKKGLVGQIKVFTGPLTGICGYELLSFKTIKELEISGEVLSPFEISIERYNFGFHDDRKDMKKVGFRSYDEVDLSKKILTEWF